MARELVLAVLVVLVVVVAVISYDRPARADDPPRVADQELGARVGARLNVAGIGPGGFYVAGSWLYRLTGALWFDGRAGFAIGGGDAACSFPTSRAPTCDSQVVSGFGLELLAGIRWFLPTPSVLTPWIGTGVGATIVDFSGDDLTGAGIPFWFAGGVRARVSDTVSVGGEADLSFGPVHYGKSLGWKGYVDLKVIFGVDFAL